MRFKTALMAEVLVALGGIMLFASMPTAMAQPDYSIKVAKTTEGDFTVTDGASYVGTYFETTYSMTGTANDFIKAKNALLASILDDFGKSTTIGYIKMNGTSNQTSGGMAGLANPFAGKEQIDGKVRSVLSYALDKIEHPVGITPNIGDSRQVKCVFGNALSDFWCDIPTFVAR
jgi:hypothetical protein